MSHSKDTDMIDRYASLQIFGSKMAGRTPLLSLSTGEQPQNAPNRHDQCSGRIKGSEKEYFLGLWSCKAKSLFELGN